MATLLSALETKVRRHLDESTASFWSSDELVGHMNGGIKELWRAINDLHQEHFLTIDASNVSLAASGTQLTGVPSDVFRVHLIEPRDLTSAGAYRHVIFEPRDLNSGDFRRARSFSAVDPSNAQVVFYAIINAGAPVAAPVIKTAPLLSATVPLTLYYVPTISDLTAAGTNPIPGDSDEAIIAWTIAHARAKEREDRSPDPEWLAMYATHKTNLLTALTPRQTQKEEVVEGMFEDESW